MVAELKLTDGWKKEKYQGEDKRNKPLPAVNWKNGFIYFIYPYTGIFFLLRHNYSWFRRGIATENIPLAGKLEASLKELTPEYLLELKRDVFYQFSR